MLLNIGLNLKMLKMSPELFGGRYTESIVDQTDHFIEVFVHKNAAYGYDVRKFTADAILFGENQCKKNIILRF